MLIFDVQIVDRRDNRGAKDMIIQQVEITTKEEVVQEATRVEASALLCNFLVNNPMLTEIFTLELIKFNL
jgi:hypothetical protein